MAETPEEILEKGKAIWEMEQTEGWQILKGQIEQEIELEVQDLINCPIEEDMEHKMAIKAYKIVLGMVDTARKDKKETEEKETEEKEQSDTSDNVVLAKFYSFRSWAAASSCSFLAV